LRQADALFAEGEAFEAAGAQKTDSFKLIFCMHLKDDMWFLLNQHAGTAVKPND
jgi:hypothetical protein